MCEGQSGVCVGVGVRGEGEGGGRRVVEKLI